MGVGYDAIDHIERVGDSERARVGGIGADGACELGEGDGGAVFDEKSVGLDRVLDQRDVFCFGHGIALVPVEWGRARCLLARRRGRWFKRWFRQRRR